ncbi:hypothetical protein BDF14DRAFT_1792752 [Spinellus fusiger]|nr:hypothetical protein BDF14DRAFT_1792752 [Spinellus fusiger]
MAMEFAEMLLSPNTLFILLASSAQSIASIELKHAPFASWPCTSAWYLSFSHLLISVTQVSVSLDKVSPVNTGALFEKRLLAVVTSMLTKGVYLDCLFKAK